MTAPINHALLQNAQPDFAALRGSHPLDKPTAILPHQLPDALAGFPDAKVLSLDCFDTLLWRDCHAPTDLFWTLPEATPLQRAKAEGSARHASIANGRGFDIPVAEIYATLLPNAPAKQRQAAIEAELDAEARHCYGFTPTIALMRAAKARGMTIIIVSDTYFDSAQLKALIGRAAGADVAAMIDRVFCSSTYRKPKAGGLYGEVLKKLKHKPAEILHIGDNHGADVGGVAPFGVQTLHLRQFGEEVEQQLRLEAAVAALIDGQAHGRLNAPQPHRAPLAANSPQMAGEAEHVGYGVLGPVFTGFDRWLRDEADALQQQRGGTVHWLFLMRDGWLPLRVHQAMGANPHAHAVEISRFTATAASFVNDSVMRGYLDNAVGTMPDIVARQLLLDPRDVDRLTKDKTPLQGTLDLLAHMRKDSNRKAARKASQTMADGIIAHIRAAADPQPGDTLMLVDLGYNGSVQNSVDRLIADTLKVHVAGRYLILRETEVTGLDKTGYLDAAQYDIVALNAMSANVAVVEQLCTRAIGSVIGYRADGTPIRRSNDIKQHQSEVRERVQQGCLAFAADHRDFSQRVATPDEADLWRRASAATLTRLMYLPLDYELRVFEAFEHDVNLGTDETLALFDPAIAKRGLRQQGLFYQKGARRMYLPAELAKEGMATRLAHFATSRFALPLTFSDFTNDGVFVPVIYADAQDTVQTTFHAKATHDGFYALCVPMGAGKFSAAIQLGAPFEYVEVSSISAMPTAEFLEGKNDTHRREVALNAILDGVTELAPNLWRCDSTAGFAFIQPPETGNETPMLMVFVFRPVVRREA